MISIGNKENCCGCKACSIVCPTSCIQFFKDAIGSCYPTVETEKCISCKKCEDVCPIQQEFNGEEIGKIAYAAYSGDNKIRFRGSSGGMFETIAAWVIKNEGSVFASKFDETLRLKCFEATSVQDVQRLTKSKYIQSDCTGVFAIIKERAQNDKPVLFCATPCQVSAVKRYLGDLAQKENVFFLDFFCHGVPSQQFFDQCIEYVEQYTGIKISAYEFRTKKRNGATPHYYSVNYEKNGKQYKRTSIYLRDPFYLGFQKYITLRDSCYACPYGKGNHCADITIGDFHNIDKYVKGINRFAGVSTVIINTDKGKMLWNSTKESLVVYDMDIHQLYEENQIYTGATPEPKRRAEFIKDMESMKFDEIVAKWFNPKAEYKKAIYYLLPAPIRKAVKQIMRIR